ncbi:lytic transglycosylase domain-containing protein [Falsigemmobacter faecalis]|uniref:Lytic transglycosylase domain-containing protein n=1 Tax=Falsigemmobacter faecalis TaxID=2488730 RepID=A0A3P3DLL4_9RHOB|nr:lytic transglycosylase domain-containing protein [Falsigemmobacter faecalis]RRH73508.1 lytic transglycosylase domain-containing protein [Falsigemmobacter faecalis]
MIRPYLLPAFAFLLTPLPGLATDALPLPVPELAAQTRDPLAEALAAASLRDWDGAKTAVTEAGPVAADVIEWMRLRAGEGTLTDYEAFLQRRPDWPGLALLRNRAETAVARSITPSRVLAWFGPRSPASVEGLLAAVKAHRAMGQQDQATALLSAAWTEMRLSALDQQAVLEAAGPALTPRDHEARLDALLWDGRNGEARQMLPLVSEGWQKLAEARLALREEREGVDGLISAVPAALAADPGLAFARFEWRMKKSRTEGAIEILRERSTSSETLGRPEAWARRRAVLARGLLREGKPREAYALAAAHHLNRSSAQADLEFLSGFIALRAMKDPKTALTHFRTLGESVSTPISVARAEYWQARAHEDLGQTEEAKAALTRAARHQTAYYGLLAAEKLGLQMEDTLVSPPPLADWKGAPFLASSVTEAALLLYNANDPANARRFLLHLAEEREAAELAALGTFALEKGDPHLAVLLGKQAAARGIILPGIYFPDPGLLPNDLAVERPLALAIARRESEFRADAVSPAGALGLMQLMPGTAKLMATKLGLPVDIPALTRDPAYNAKLGSAYLAHLAEEFGPSIALRAAGYNAGPGRPRAWITQFGDPRRADVDVIDWVEHVPFEETRTYIMRVTEGLAIYQARLTPGAPLAITSLLRG